MPIAMTSYCNFRATNYSETFNNFYHQQFIKVAMPEDDIKKLTKHAKQQANELKESGMRNHDQMDQIKALMREKQEKEGKPATVENKLPYTGNIWRGKILVNLRICDNSPNFYSSNV